MTREIIEGMFDDFVLRNSARAASLNKVRAASNLADLKNRMNAIPYAGAEKVAQMILLHKSDLEIIVPGPKSEHHIFETDRYNDLMCCLSQFTPL